jgi:hypothetical protein
MDIANYRIAHIKDDAKFRDQLAKYEAEISQEFGEQVVLIAYGKDQSSPNTNS